MAAVGYIRVSTEEQNTARQLDGIDLVKEYTEKITGKDINRPQLQEMISWVRDGDVVYVHSMDRLARSLIDLREIVQKLTDKGVTVLFVKENMEFSRDESDPFKELMLNMMGAFAEFERNLMLSRQREGIAKAKAAGKYKGRKPSLTVKQADEMRSLADAGVPKSKLARQFGVSRDTVYEYLAAKAA